MARPADRLSRDRLAADGEIVAEPDAEGVRRVVGLAVRRYLVKGLALGAVTGK